MAEERTGEEKEVREFKLVIQALFLAMKLTEKMSVTLERKEKDSRLARIGLKALLPGGEAARANWKDWAKTRRAA